MSAFDWFQTVAGVASISGAVAIVTSALTAAVTSIGLGRQYQLEFAAERIARSLLTDARFKQRTFEIIKLRLGGFDDDELRRILVRSGAVRYFVKGVELWGLPSQLKKVKKDLDDNSR